MLRDRPWRTLHVRLPFKTSLPILYDMIEVVGKQRGDGGREGRWCGVVGLSDVQG